MNKEEVKKYLQDNKLDIQSAVVAFAVADHVFRSYLDSDLVHHSPVPPFFPYYKDKKFMQITHERELMKIMEGVYTEYLRNEKIIDELIAAHETLTQKLDVLWQEREDTVKFYDRFIELSEEWWHYGIICEDKGKALGVTVVAYFQKKYSLTFPEAEEMVRVLSHPEEFSLFNAERVQFFALCLEVLTKSLTAPEADPEFLKKLQEYLAQFFWRDSNFRKYKEITLESLWQEIRTEVQSHNKQEIENEIAKMENGLHSIEQAKQVYEQKFSLNEEDRKQLYFARRIIQWLDIRKLGMMKDIYYYTSLKESMAGGKGMSYDEATLLTDAEFRAWFCGESDPAAILAERTKFGIMAVFDNHEISYFIDEDNEFSAIIQTIVLGDKGIKGLVASRGNVEMLTGKVSVMMTPDKDVFAEGTILVTSMTRIEFVPFMKKAVAVITDEGGIACHAAIVSRELGIPCIIATKNATRILKSGDTVEMNLKTGTIKKVN